MAALFLLLWLITIGVPRPEEDEGIMVSFGEMETGGGRPDGLTAAASVPETTAPAPAKPTSDELMTQEDEEALALAWQREEELRRQREAEEAQRRAEEQRLAEQRAKEQAAIARANQMGALFGQTDTDEGSNGMPGESASSATKGNPIGHGSSGGNKWSLDGRRLIGSLPQPSGKFEPGKVVIRIMVNAEGKVISATQAAGTDISDYATIQMAKNAAMKAQFDMIDKPDRAIGTITYYFKLK